MSVEPEAQYDKIYRYCYYKVHHRQLAEDLTQETFLCYFSQTSYLNRGKQLAYLYTIASHLCVDYYRHHTEEALPEETAADETDELDTRIIIREAVKQLSEEKRELILLRYAGQLTKLETAQSLGISRYAEYRREKDALKELKNLIGEECME